MIVFLDIDGVMHPVGASVDRLFEHAELLAAWLDEQPGIQLVVSSSWRETHSLDDIREMLFHFAPDLQGRVIGVTPTTARDLGAGDERSAECQAWLSENGHEHMAWVALDDDASLFDQRLRGDHLVHCKPRTGLDRSRLSFALRKLHRQQRDDSPRRRYRSANPPTRAIGLDEQAEIVAFIDRARQAKAKAASAAVAAAAARRNQWMALPVDQRWATLLIDIDEVLCVGQPFAASSLHKAFADGLLPEPDFLNALFSPAAREALLQVHDQLRGRLRYVISSSWREYFTREQIELILRETGFGFVAESLHAGEAWRCHRAAITTDRQLDIEAWLKHFHSGEPFVVVDDRYSGGPLNFHHHFHPAQALFGRVVICPTGVGLTMDQAEDILAVLRRPA